MEKNTTCFYPADIMLPDFSKTDASRWACVACDQFTSQPEYWEKAVEYIGGALSTLDMILPEAWLAQSETKIPEINSRMKEYMNKLTVHKNSMIYTERTQSDGGIRRGIVGMIDLECYDYNRTSSSLIRATEGTVAERIPPRVVIRRGACLELPHAMLLIDDPGRTVIEPLEASTVNAQVAYDTKLMLGGGSIRGKFLTQSDIARVEKALGKLIHAENGKAPLLFAVGDGNHSLAGAKAAYEEIKARIGNDAAKNHPARYALCEIINLHDDALKFEPIYRVMTGVVYESITAELKEYTGALSGNAAGQTITCVSGENQTVIQCEHPAQQLAVGTLQTFIDGYLAHHKEAKVDYIHGEEAARMLSRKAGSVAFLFDGMSKEQLFPTIIYDGALPRKTFSMGHAEDKRYYMEARRIIP